MPAGSSPQRERRYARGPVSPTGDRLCEQARKRDMHGRSAVGKRQPAKALDH
ncbi:hypothetical protein [Streptomyces sp. NPDC010273]|uniref:hypothetical protein n=1 Tax=Streptomyces sp. NPDC010273 TaxID=3364829 RepID=UPI0036ECE667